MPATPHAEHVGSLLRPSELLEARQARERGEIGADKLAELEDAAALAAIELQRQAGMEVFTDGEMRRKTWLAGLLESLDGVTPVPLPSTEWWRGDGEPVPPEETSWDMVVATGKLTQKANLTSVEAGFLARHAPGPYKITMVSSSMGHLLWHPDLSADAYPTPADLLRDLVALRVEEIRHLLAQGVRWIQLDSLAYDFVIDPGFRARVLGPAAPDAEDLLDAAVAVDAQQVRAAKELDPGVTVALHLCRGNNRSAWAAKGAYDPVAERLFGEVPVDRFLLEYDTERAGGFEPLRFVPQGTVVVLGLVSSKVPALESKDELRRRIDEAAKYVPMENLAISPQCGFASTSRGNLLTVDEERRKLELVVETARLVWG
ncbi:cobalamin-independent methionine synthase II family protein [Nonomuraea sp. FMUSA5-5]|uniref:Cobalamin-independent methionine synthase II family protein n=1 Tax=Nonomuraea composti TaxID=2720023 RepID=A0ABX1B9J7_9ACTN|nr:cobalamin-independent methionine synthase II family protein [Nonomuraea sp. FMUSA5-5]NJP92449.1 cobalamin-independent methionine synthase II family protein [Nonomuraea sp. FMUSA5-5]